MHSVQFIQITHARILTIQNIGLSQRYELRNTPPHPQIKTKKGVVSLSYQTHSPSQSMSAWGLYKADATFSDY